RLEDHQGPDRLLASAGVGALECQSTHVVGGDHDPALLQLPAVEGVGLRRLLEGQFAEHPLAHRGDDEGELYLGVPLAGGAVGVGGLVHLFDLGSDGEIRHGTRPFPVMYFAAYVLLAGADRPRAYVWWGTYRKGK